MITGLLPPLKGEVFFNGDPLPLALKNRSVEQLRQIQMIYQMADTAMNPRHTVREIIGRPLEFYFGMRGAKADARVMELLTLIELDESFMDRLPSNSLAAKNNGSVLREPWRRIPTSSSATRSHQHSTRLCRKGFWSLLRLQEELGISYIFIPTTSPRSALFPMRSW